MGDGIYNNGLLTLSGSTLSGNSATQGGASTKGPLGSCTLSLSNSISGMVSSQGFNLIGNTSGSSGYGVFGAAWWLMCRPMPPIARSSYSK